MGFVTVLIVQTRKLRARKTSERKDNVPSTHRLLAIEHPASDAKGQVGWQAEGVRRTDPLGAALCPVGSPLSDGITGRTWVASQLEGRGWVPMWDLLGCVPGGRQAPRAEQGHPVC